MWCQTPSPSQQKSCALSVPCVYFTVIRSMSAISQSATVKLFHPFPLILTGFIGFPSTPSIHVSNQLKLTVLKSCLGFLCVPFCSSLYSQERQYLTLPVSIQYLPVHIQYIYLVYIYPLSMPRYFTFFFSYNYNQTTLQSVAHLM